MPENSDNTFRPAKRLRARKQFDLVYKFRKRVRKHHFTINYRPNECGHDRLGLTVSKKAGNAATRNRIKRRIREIFRTLHSRQEPFVDLVVRPEKPFLQANFKQLKRDWLEAISYIKARLAR